VVITPASSAPARPADAEEARKVAEMQAALTAGEFDKAVEQANAYLKSTRDESGKTEALRVLAEALRKKGDWKQAPAAHLRLRERFEKNSEDWVRYDAIAEVLRASPAGVYQPAGGPAPKAAAPGATAATLADDNALTEALARLAGGRAGKLKARIPAILRAATPQLVMAAFTPVLEETKMVFAVSADAPPDAAREVGAAAGKRLQALGTQIIPVLNAKAEKYQPKMNAPWSFTNQEKADIKSTQAACKEMTDCEKQFQQALFIMTGKGDWPDADRLRKESADRGTSYEELSNKFYVPRYTTSFW
jgi:tetratricopeptide (TPR) repeat protein